MKVTQVIRWGSAGIAVLSVLSCVFIAATKSLGLTSVKVTAIDPAEELVDHVLPLIKQKEALPDYEIVVQMTDGRTIQLGSKPDTSAAKGLEWIVSDPICAADIATVRLLERDVMVSDAVAEVQVQQNPVTSNGYRFDFTTERSIGVGIHSFFGTPIGMVILGAFFLAVVMIIVASFLW